MEQLRVLAGEPLLVIDFRYHLVSLIAVFLAVALGIIIGTTALNEPLQANIEGQVTELERDKRSLEDRTQELQAQLETADAFGQAVTPALVDGVLDGSSVLLIAGNEDVTAETVEEISALIGESGGSVAGTIRLQPEYTDPSSASALQSYVTGSGLLPSGAQLPPTDDTGQLVASLLAQVLMVPADGGTTPDSAAIATVLAGLTSLGVLAPEGSGVTPADYVLFLTAGTFTGDGADERNATLIELVSALDAEGSGAVVAGDPPSAQANGLVGVIRSDPDLSAAISTVDNADTAAGRISTVLALAAEGEGTSGAYGIGEDAQPVPPVPAATP
jgi:hypothetical protein